MRHLPYAPFLLVFGLVLGGGLVGCSTYQETRTPVHAVDEVASIRQELGCSWQKAPDVLYPVSGADYACVLDMFSSVILFVAPDPDVIDTGAPAIQTLTLIWKEWDPQFHTTHSKPDASRAIAYLAHRFFPTYEEVKVVTTFLGRKNKTLEGNDLLADYSYAQQPTLGLHKLEIRSINRHNQWFALDKNKNNEAEEKTAH